MRASYLTEPPITDGNSPWNEAFSFPSIEAWRSFATRHPELFDEDLSPQDRAERWKLFAYTSEGQSLRAR